MLRLLSWIAFAWGALMCGTSIYYASFWFPDPSNLRFNEAKIGYWIGLVYGWPAWLFLPAFVALRWHRLPPWERTALLAPPMLALLVFAAGSYLSQA